MKHCALMALDGWKDLVFLLAKASAYNTEDANTVMRGRIDEPAVQLKY